MSSSLLHVINYLQYTGVQYPFKSSSTPITAAHSPILPTSSPCCSSVSSIIPVTIGNRPEGHHNKQHMNLANLRPFPLSSQPITKQRHLKLALLNTETGVCASLKPGTNPWIISH